MNPSARVDENGTVMGYPLRFCQAPPAYQFSGHSEASPPNVTAAATSHAYPYAEQAQQPVYGSSVRYVRQNHVRRCIQCWIGILILTFVTAAALLTLIAICESIQSPKFRLDSISVSPFDLSASRITAGWNVGFFARNPNKLMGIAFDPVDVSVYYKSKLLAGKMVVPFEVGPKNQTVLQATISSLSREIDGWAASAIVEDRKQGAVDFDVMLRARVQYWFPSRKHCWIVVSCEGVKVGFSSDEMSGTMLGGSKDCTFQEKELS